jgi:hypothetical protein
MLFFSIQNPEPGLSTYQTDHKMAQTQVTFQANAAQQSARVFIAGQRHVEKFHRL